MKILPLIAKKTDSLGYIFVAEKYGSDFNDRAVIGLSCEFGEITPLEIINFGTNRKPVCDFLC